MAVGLGVDALGFIFTSSERVVTPREARKIIQSLPPFVDRVGVFVNETPQKVEEIVRFCSLTTLQFHGEESASYCARFSCKTIKSFPVKDRVPDNISEYRVDAYLLDTFCPGKRGGSGRAFNWEIAKKVSQLGFPLILSGGLTSYNVREAISTVRPYAIDVASGVEERPGKKSREKLQEFIQMVRYDDEVLQTT